MLLGPSAAIQQAKTA
ncbi:Mitochondrial import receptor subunit TOM22 homolog [Caenorhabditis elegans]|uniref:Isoform b of Mitochondrial import receptor subunit TOM22 homolog n=2 Tax=Caenorhabditis TaxID=6237 RepID=O17287-2|nr:Mitochondrial import receptor subunit TOM22 homolog [Caenorhabditis elegans]CUR29997.1 Mitochondrial import receptor subunit TOM22 homolog [Caenorhabditis elegans]|eukprot:NP_001303802.1 Mitochondrial import receptor subunit TOM22 homolog [Caenorhabditis elegans]